MVQTRVFLNTSGAIQNSCYKKTKNRNKVNTITVVFYNNKKITLSKTQPH